MTLDANLPGYLASWSQELSSRANRVRMLLGDRHWLSDGGHREFILKEFLHRHLPPALTLQRGFIVDISNANATSKEIDLLLTNPASHVPLFNEGGLQIAVPSAAIATIEVKATYNVPQMRNALQNVAVCRSIVLRADSSQLLWSGIIFTAAGDCERPSAFLAQLVDLCSELATDGDLAALQGGGTAHAHRLPIVVAILGLGLAIIGKSHDSSDEYRFYECREHTAAVAMAHLFSTVRAVCSQRTLPGELDDLISQLPLFPMSCIAIPSGNV